MPLIWLGAQVSARVRDAAREAIAETIEEASHRAADIVHSEWHDTGVAGDSVLRHPRPVFGQHPVVVGRWGSRLWRFIFIEKGTARMAGGHMLTRSADAVYGGLAGRIRGRLRLG